MKEYPNLIKPHLKLPLIIFLSLLLFTRFYNLKNTARFIWDESSDLVRMHQYYIDKTITLVGPISEDGTKVFSSLTYYLLLPFTILGQFDPASPAYGTALYGLLTAILLLLLAKKINPSLIIPVAILTLFWFPLVQTSRWAWNPNFIPFWTALSLLLLLRNTPLSLLLSGLTLGLTIHHHYLSTFAVAGFWLVLLFHFHSQKKPLLFATFSLGLLITLLPFLIFDIRHPPGLFLTKILYFSHTQAPTSPLSLIPQLAYLYKSMLFYFTRNAPATYALTLLIPLTLLFDLKTKKPLFFAIPWIFHLITLCFIYYDGQSEHYFLPALAFFLGWLIAPRPNLSQLLAKIILFTLVISSLLSIIPQLTTKTWQTNIPMVKAVVQHIKVEILSKDLKNSNIAVLSSPDNNTYGRRYRDLLLIQNILLKTKEEYQYSDHLFAISTATEEILRKDPAYEMKYFHSGPLINSWPIPNSPWTLFRFDRNPKL